MPDPRFFTVAGPFTLQKLAAIAGAEIGPGTDPDAVFTDVAPLDAAGPTDVSFLDNKKYVGAFETSRAGACLVHPDLASRAPSGMALLVTRKPYTAYALVAQAFYPVPAPRPGIAPGAIVDPTAEIGEGTEIAAGAVVGAGARIGARCRIASNAVIGERVEIGDDTTIGACSSLSHCLIGSRVNDLSRSADRNGRFRFRDGPGGLRPRSPAWPRHHRGRRRGRLQFDHRPWRRA